MNRLWLDRVLHTYGDCTGTARWLLDFAAVTVGNLATHTDDAEAQEIGRKAEIVEEIALRPPNTTISVVLGDWKVAHPVEVADEELEAIKDVLEEAFGYWLLCDYAHNEGLDEEILAGILAEQYGPEAGPNLAFVMAATPVDHPILVNGLGKGPMWPIWGDVYGPLVDQ